MNKVNQAAKNVLWVCTWQMWNRSTAVARFVTKVNTKTKLENQNAQHVMQASGAIQFQHSQSPPAKSATQESTHLLLVLLLKRIVMDVRLEKLQTKKETRTLHCVSLAFRTLTLTSLVVLHVDHVIARVRQQKVLHFVVNAMQDSTC